MRKTQEALTTSAGWTFGRDGVRRAAVLASAAIIFTGCGATPGAMMSAQAPLGTPTATSCWTDEQRVTEGEDMPTQNSAPPAMRIDPAKTYTGTIETNKGPIEIELYPEDAPQTVNNFVCLAEDGYFDATPFHRIVKGFVIQGGDPTGTGTGGPGYRFNDEPVKKDYERGILAMANAGPNTNGSQFFLISGPSGVRLPPQYNHFGKITEGLDILDRMEKVATGPGDRPREDVVINRVTITES